MLEGVMPSFVISRLVKRPVDSIVGTSLSNPQAIPSRRRPHS